MQETKMKTKFWLFDQEADADASPEELRQGMSEDGYIEGLEWGLGSKPNIYEGEQCFHAGCQRMTKTGINGKYACEKHETELMKKENPGLIYAYSLRQAEEDGILFNMDLLGDSFKGKIFSHMTDNLLTAHYLNHKEKKINHAALRDLVMHAWNIMRKDSQNFQRFDHFFSGTIELPNGKKQKIFMQQNETKRFTIMLPEDY